MTRSPALADTTTTVPRNSADARIFGGMLLSLGLSWMFREMGADLSWEAILASGLTALGLGMMATPKAGHGLRLVLAGVVLTVVLAGSSVETAGWMKGIGDQTVTPISIRELAREYEQGIGDLDLDLAGVEFPTGTTFVTVKMGVGDLTVWVPQGVRVVLQADVGMGDVEAFGAELADGVGIHRRFDTGGDPARQLLIDLKLGLGDITIHRTGTGTTSEPGSQERVT